MKTFANKIHSHKKGSLLLELLIVIALLAIILATGSEAVFVSLQSGKVSGERDVAMALANEALEATRSATEENWLNTYLLTRGAQYYATSTASAGKWTLVSGSQTILLNNATYARYVVFSDVSRDVTTRNIETTYNADNKDPSTQKVTVTVSWPNADPVTASEYLFRWKNKSCGQGAGGWVGTGGSGNTVQACGTTTYDTIDTTVSTSSGTLKLI